MFWKEKEEKEKIWKSWVYNFQEEKEEKEKWFESVDHVLKRKGRKGKDMKKLGV